MFAVRHLIRIALALVFLTSGVVKLFDVSGFSESIGDFGILPDGMVSVSAWLITLLELGIGLMLTLNFRYSHGAALTLLLMFTGVLGYGINLGLDIHCGCFGAGFRVSLQNQLLIDIGLVCVCCISWWMENSTQRPDSPVQQPMEPSINDLDQD